jgi:hypothetical protein
MGRVLSKFTQTKIKKMSTKAKGTSIEKIVAIFDKIDLDDAIKVFNDLKAHLSGKISTRQKELEDKASDLQSTLDRINGSQ